jgi:hypothetical protein
LADIFERSNENITSNVMYIEELEGHAPSRLPEVPAKEIWKPKRLSSKDKVTKRSMTGPELAIQAADKAEALVAKKSQKIIKVSHA